MINKLVLVLEKKIWKSINTENRIGLLDGLSGTALFYNSLIELEYKKSYFKKLTFIVNKINRLVNEHHQGFSLCSGLAGFGWLLNTIKNKNIVIDESYFEVIDEILINELNNESNKNNYDFMHGAMGIALYLLDRCKDNNQTSIVNVLNVFLFELNAKILNNLESIIIREKSFINEKHVFFGIAHGVAGIINFLTYIKINFKQSNVGLNEAIALCSEYVLKFKFLDSNSKQFYPHTLYVESNIVNQAIFGWCQGDLGIACAFFNAQIILQNEVLQTEAIELFKNSRRITFNDSGIKDFGICHGSTGIVAQYFLLNLKFDIECTAMINYWLDCIKDQTKNFELFLAHQGNNNYKEDFTLLNGVTGLAMVVLTVENKIHINWLNILNLH